MPHFNSLLLAAILAAAPAHASDSTTKTYPPGAAKRLIVSTDSGPIKVAGLIDAPITVDITPAAPGDDCIFTQELRNGTLYLDAHARKKAFWIRESCSAGFTVFVNADAIEASSGSGDVTVGGLYKKASIKTGSGSIAIDGSGKNAHLTLQTGSGKISGSAGARIDAKTGSGAIQLSGLTGVATARTGSGAISLDWKSAPASGDIDVRTGSGDFTASLPASAKLLIDFQSGSGKLDSEFGSDAQAPLHLTFRSGSGGAALKKKI